MTPDVKAFQVPLGGYAARRGALATGVHDPVYARAVVLSDGKVKVGIVSLDLCFLPANVKAEVVKRVQAAGVKGLDADHLFLAATHTHSAPDPLVMHSGNTFTGLKGWRAFDAKLLDFTAGKIAEAIIQADKNQVPAGVNEGVLEPKWVEPTPGNRIESLNRNRRGEKNTDKAITVLKVTSNEDMPIALLVNYAAHPTLYSDKMMQVSADWPGALTAKLEDSMGGVCLFLNGAEGDVSPNGAAGTTAEERVANYASLLTTVIEAWFKAFAGQNSGLTLSPQKSVPLAAWTQTVNLPPRKPNGGFLVAALSLGATLEQAKQFVTQLMPEKTQISFVRIGDLLLMGFPCEPTTPLGLAAKAAAKKAGFKTPAVVALTNDWLGYALTPEQYKAGGYEPTMSFYGDQLGPTLLTALQAGLRTHSLPAANSSGQ